MRARALVGALAAVATFGAFACEPVVDTPVQLYDGVYCLTADIDIGGATPFVLHDDTTLTTSSYLQNLAVCWSSPYESCPIQHQTGLKPHAAPGLGPRSP
jgi:hypothetical protein